MGYGVTTYADQIGRAIGRAQTLAGTVADPWARSRIFAAVAELEAAWNAAYIHTMDENAIDRCKAWSTQSTDYQRLRFGVECGEWSDGLSAALENLSVEIAPLDPPQAEVLESLNDQQATAREQGGEIIGAPADWWDALPNPAKAAILIAAGWLVIDVWSKVK